MTSGLKYEIIIVDNCSTDGTLEMLEKDFSQCKMIINRCNLGFAKASNLAARYGSGRYILYLNPDTILKTNALLKMRDFLEKNEEYGAVGCKLLNTDGSIQYVCARTYPSPLKEFNELAMLNRIFPQSTIFDTSELNGWNHEDSRDIDCISGACMMMRVNLVNEMKGFDEEFFMYAEDVDLCYRIVKKGWKIYYLSDEIIIHYGGASAKKNQIKYFGTVEERRANYKFIRKHYGKLKAFEYRLAVFLGSIIRIIIVPLYVFYKSTFDKKIDMSDLLNKYFTLLHWSVKG
jgi:hypothetical protein